MPVVLRLGTLVQCAEPPHTSPHTADTDHMDSHHRGLRGLFATKSHNSPDAPRMSSSSPTSQNPSVTDTSKRHVHHNSSSSSGGGGNGSLAGGLPLKRLLRRAKEKDTEGGPAPEADAHILMPLCISQCLSSNTTSSAAIQTFLDAIRVQLVRGQLVSCEQYMQLGRAPISWLQRDFHDPTLNVKDTNDGSSISTKKSKKKKKQQQLKATSLLEESKRGKTKHNTKGRAVWSDSLLEDGSFFDLSTRAKDARFQVWCLCCRDSQGTFRYCGQYRPFSAFVTPTCTPVTSPVGTSTEPTFPALASSSPAGKMKLKRSKRKASPSKGVNGGTGLSLPVSPGVEEPRLTQIGFIIDACVSCHRELAAAHDAEMAREQEEATGCSSETESDPFCTPRILSHSGSDAARAYRADDGASPRGLASSLLAGLSASCEDCDSRSFSRYTSEVFDSTASPRHQYLPGVASSKTGTVSSVDATRTDHGKPPLQVGSLHQLFSPLPSDAAVVAPVQSRWPAGETARHDQHTHTPTHSPRRSNRALKFAMLYGVVVPLAVLVMLNPYITTGPGAPGTPTARRHGRWRRKEEREISSAAVNDLRNTNNSSSSAKKATTMGGSARSPTSPTSPNTPHRRRGEFKPRGRRVTFAVAEAVEVPVLLSREPLISRPPGRSRSGATNINHKKPSRSLLIMERAQETSTDAHAPNTAVLVPPLTGFLPPNAASHGSSSSNDGAATSHHSSRRQAARDCLPPLSPDSASPRVREAPPPPSVPLPASEMNKDKALTSAAAQLVEDSAQRMPWLSEESTARFAQNYSAARHRLHQAHRDYREAMAALRAETAAKPIQRADSGEAEVSAVLGMPPGWALWGDMWHGQSPSRSPMKSSETLASREACAASGGDLDTRLHDLVRRRLVLEEELKQCAEAEREAETLSMLIHVYEQDLESSRERQAALESATRS